MRFSLAPCRQLFQTLSRGRFSRSERGSVTVEFVLLLPAIASLLAVVVFGGEGFEISRKLTMTVRTLADLASQQTDVGSSATYPYSSLLTAASLVISPYDATPLGMTLSEIKVTGSNTGTVVWSKANAHGTALTKNSTVTTPNNIATGSYLILGQATYSYNPLQLYLSSNPVTLNSSLYLSPRQTSVGCTGC